MTTEPIRLSLRRWAALSAGTDPEFETTYRGLVPGSTFGIRIEARRKVDGVMFVAETYAMFHMDTDWESEGYLTTLYPSVPRTVWDLPAKR